MKNFTNQILLLLLSLSASGQDGPGGVGSTADLVFWLDASEISQTNGTAISSWSDVYGNGVNFTQSISNSRPVFNSTGLNGSPSVNFVNGSNRFLSSGAIPAMQSNDKSWFIVGSSYNVHAGGFYGSINSAASPSNVLFKTGVNTGSGGVLFSYHRLNSSLGSSGIAHTTAPLIINTNIDQDTDVRHYYNGSLSSSFSGTARTPGAHINSQLGRYPNAPKYLNGQISEIFHYNISLNDAQRIIVNNYLSSKYSISIPGAEDFYSLEGSGYNQGLVGIGRISANTHNDSKGNGIMQIFNATSLDVDGDVIMIAHNSEATTTNNTNVPASFGASNGRVMDRIWRIDYNGTPGNFDLTVHMDGINFGASNNDYVLIYDTDDDFTSGATTMVPTSIVGDKITFTGLNSTTIVDGGYFTIATINGIISINGGGAWNNTASWNCACIPSGSRNPIITDGNPITLTSDIDISDVEIEPASSLTIDDDVFLDIYGDLQADGSLFASLAGLNFIGTTSTQNITVGGPFNVGYIEAMNSDGIVWTGNDVVLVLAMYPELGNFDVSGLNSFTLRSNASQTAYVAAGNSGSSLTGNFTVQRFMPGGNADYRDVTSPNLIADFTDWDDDFIISGTNFSDGCAFGNGCFHSIKYWNSLTQEYEDVTNPNDNLVSYLGYEVFFGDDLSTFSDTTISVTGPLRSFTQQNIAIRDGFSLIGNVYASQIDFDELTREGNIGNFYYVYDTQSGAFEYYDPTDPGGSNLSDIIASGQAFWVHNTTASTDFLRFNQDDKTEDIPTFIRSTQGADNKFNISLKGPTKDYHTDANVIFTSNNRGSSGLSGIPALITEHQKAPALFFMVEDEKMRSAKLLPGRDDVKVQVGMQFFEDGTHEISFSNNDLFRAYEYVYLIDKVTGKMLAIEENTNLRFEAKKQKDQDFRFELLFTNTNNDGFASTERLVDIYKFDNENIKFDLQLNQTAKNVNISIFNSVGQLMYIQDYQDLDSQILNRNVAEFAPGIYIVNVIIDGQKFVEKIVIE